MVDKAVKKIRPDDQQLSMVQDNLAQAIQQLLDFANGTASPQTILAPIMQQLQGVGTAFSVKTPALTVKGRPDGTFIPNQPTMVLGEAQYVTPQGQTVPQKDNEIFAYGQIVAFGSRGTPDGFVIIPYTAGAALRVTAIGNTATNFQVDTNGQCYSVSFNSSNGFKTQLSVGEYWNTAPGSGVNFQFQRTVSNVQNNGLGTTPFIMKWTHAGSIVGMSLNEAGPNTAGKQILVYRNGTLIYTWVAGAAGNNATFWATFNKGFMPFAAGDTMTVYGNVASTSNTQLMCHFTLEMAA